MSKSCKIAAVLGMGLMLAPLAVVAQTPAAQPVETPTSGAMPIQTGVPGRKITSVQLRSSAASETIPPDQQATKEQLDKLFEVMRVREQMASLTKIMPALMQQQFNHMQQEYSGKSHLTEEQQLALSNLQGKFMGKVLSLYTSDEMIDDMESIYRKYLTRSDVDGMIAFYSSPAGQHMVEMQPAIMKEFMPTVMQRMQDRMKPLIDEMTEETRAIIGSPLLVTPPPPPPPPPADKPAAK